MPLFQYSSSLIAIKILLYLTQAAGLFIIHPFAETDRRDSRLQMKFMLPVGPVICILYQSRRKFFFESDI